MNKEHIKNKWIWTGLMCAAIGVGFAIFSTQPDIITEELPISKALESTLEPMPAPEPIDLEDIER